MRPSTQNKKVDVLVVNEQPLLLEGLTHILKSRPYIALVHEASSMKKAFMIINRYKPGLVLIDCNLKKECCHDNIHRLKAFKHSMEVLMMSRDFDEIIAKNLQSKEAVSFIRKDMSINEITTEIERSLKIDRKEKYEANHLINEFDLKERELEVIHLLCKSLSSKEIAIIMRLSKDTVDGYRKRILKKMKLPNTAGVVQWAVKNGISEIG